jgi:hypothetical protein
MKQAFLLYFLITFCTASYSKNSCNLEGIITNEKGEAIPYVNIFIQEISSASMANINGRFDIPVKCGNYKLNIQSAGYESKSISIDENSESIQIQLKPINYLFPDVTDSPTLEDPSYNIMRKAIVMAQYYKKQIEGYQTDMYIRSFSDVDNIPTLIKKFAEKEGLGEVQMGDLIETILNYSYANPNTVNENFSAKKADLKDTTRAIPSYINLDFYQLGGKEVINPLSRNTFKVYRFEYHGSYSEDNKKIHKIKIIPKRKGSYLISGFLYINDGLWNINHVDVVLQKQYFQVEYKQRYNEIKPLVWMPTNHKIKVSGKGLGLRFQLNYLASLSDLTVQTDYKIDAHIDNNYEASKGNLENSESNIILNNSAEQHKIEQLISKKTLTNRETYKLVRLIKKLQKKRERNDATRSMEVKFIHTINYADSAFNQSDSAWKAMRKIPLSDKELETFKAIHSNEKVANEESESAKKPNLLKDLFLFNDKIISKNKKHIFEPKGILIGAFPYYNTVDGFLPVKSLLDYTWDNRKDKFIKITPIVGYAVARKTYTGRLEIKSQYNKEKRGLISISGGRRTTGFNQNDPISDRLNTISTTFFTGNVKKLFQHDFIKLDHQIDVINGLVFSFGGEYANRQALSNNSDFKLLDIMNREYTPNVPENLEVLNNPTLISNNTAVTFRAKLEWTPRQFFTFKDNQKVLLESNYPTFGIGYRKGIQGVLNSQADYDLIKISMQQTFPFLLLDKVNYYFEAGRFFNSNSIYFADYQNFNSAPTFVIDNPKINGFRLLDYYGFNTKDYYIESHFSVENDHLLLKFLPGLNKTNMDEKLEFGYLLTDRNIHYAELGLSLTKIFYLMDAGIFASFEDAQFERLAVKVSFYFLQ